MATSNQVDIKKFHNDFQNHPRFNDIVKRINDSPYLAGLINQFPGKIVIGELNSGNTFNSNKKKISIEQNRFDQLKDPADPNFTAMDQLKLDFLMLSLAHELGHALLPGGYHTTVRNLSLPQNVERDLVGEGVATYAAYKTTRELNMKIWSYNNGVLQQIKALEKQFNGDVDHPDFIAQTVQIGANYIRNSTPSCAPFLNYEQYYSLGNARALCETPLNRNDLNRIDWRQIKPTDFQIENRPDGSCRLTGQIPLIPLQTAPTTTPQATQSPPTATPSSSTVSSSSMILDMHINAPEAQLSTTLRNRPSHRNDNMVTRSNPTATEEQSLHDNAASLIIKHDELVEQTKHAWTQREQTKAANPSQGSIEESLRADYEKHMEKARQILAQMEQPEATKSNQNDGDYNIKSIQNDVWTPSPRSDNTHSAQGDARTPSSRGDNTSSAQGDARTSSSRGDNTSSAQSDARTSSSRSDNTRSAQGDARTPSSRGDNTHSAQSDASTPSHQGDCHPVKTEEFKTIRDRFIGAVRGIEGQSSARSAHADQIEARLRQDFGIPANSRELIGLTSLGMDNYNAYFGEHTNTHQNLKILFNPQSSPEERAQARGEVFYEIACRSNIQRTTERGIQRYAEAELFGPSAHNESATQAQAKNQVFLSHQAQIKSYQADLGQNNRYDINISKIAHSRVQTAISGTSHTEQTISTSATQSDANRERQLSDVIRHTISTSPTQGDANTKSVQGDANTKSIQGDANTQSVQSTQTKPPEGLPRDRDKLIQHIIEDTKQKTEITRQEELTRQAEATKSSPSAKSNSCKPLPEEPQTQANAGQASVQELEQQRLEIEAQLAQKIAQIEQAKQNELAKQKAQKQTLNPSVCVPQDDSVMQAEERAQREEQERQAEERLAAEAAARQKTSAESTQQQPSHTVENICLVTGAAALAVSASHAQASTNVNTSINTTVNANTSINDHSTANTCTPVTPSASASNTTSRATTNQRVSANGITFENTGMARMLPTQQGITPHTTSRFGEEREGDRTHGGVDFNYHGGQRGINLTNPQVHSPITGEVVYSGGSYGTVKICDDRGNTHEILHLNTRLVRPGDRVEAGTPIGTMGGRGPNGPEEYPHHVHYQIKNRYGQLMDPVNWWSNPVNVATINRTLPATSNDSIRSQPASDSSIAPVAGSSRAVSTHTQEGSAHKSQASKPVSAVGVVMGAGSAAGPNNAHKAIANEQEESNPPPKQAAASSHCDCVPH